jgi:hypothetical protein
MEARSGQMLIEMDARYFCPTEVDLLVGDQECAPAVRLAAQDQLRRHGEGDGYGRHGSHASRNRAKEPP